MPRAWRFRIADILKAIEAIESYIRRMNKARFEADRRTFDAVLHNLQVIGEAARHVPKTIKGRYPDIPWPKIEI